MKLSEKESQKVLLMENSMEDVYTKLESEIDRIVTVAKDMDYEEYPRSDNQLRNLFDGFLSTWVRSDNRLLNEWHDYRFPTELALKEIFTKLNEPCVWPCKCFCDKCLIAYKIKKEKEKNLRNKKKKFSNP